MKDNKGQALIEFILIIPIFMFILLSIIDIGNIVISKYKLEDNISVVADLYQQNRQSELNDYIKSNNLIIYYNNNTDYTNIVLEKNVNIITPGLNVILGRKMNIQTERSIYHE